MKSKRNKPKMKKEKGFFDDIKTKKPKQNIALKNLKEEIKEILSPCIKCGMCKSLCPAFKSLRIEEVSPRGHSIMLSEEDINEFIYQCNLCKACEEKCPLNLKICDAVKKARELMVLNGNELESNKEMMKNIRKNGNPFGEDTSDPDKLYCC